MSDTVIVGILALIGTLVGSYFSNRKNSALIAYRMEQLEQKVNKHKLERYESIIEEQIKVINHRIEDLEK